MKKLFFVTCALAMSSIPAIAQNYPSRAVTMIVPFPAGGGLDAMARTLGQRLADRLGKPVVVENRAGAAGITGATAVSRAAPDGYTLLVGSGSSLAISATLRKDLPYDPAKDFVPLALVAYNPFVLVVNASLPVHSVPDLIKLAKEKPGSLSYASGGPGHPAHIYAEMLKRMAGIEMVHVPYKGVAPALNDVVGGHVPLMFVDLLPALQLIADGRVRALAVSSVSRVPSVSQIPPMTEVGFPGFDAAVWSMIVAPANTPAEIASKLRAELKIILALPEIRDWIVNNGMTPASSLSPEELQTFVKSEIVRWSEILEQIGIARSQ
jgi:tripartite-type tricarboxylate transporter receptor subunit TctC